MNEPQRYYAKSNEPVTKRQVLYDPIYLRYLQQSDSQTQEAERQLLGNGKLLRHGYTASAWGNEKVLYRRVMVTTEQQYECASCHQTTCLKMVTTVNVTFCIVTTHTHTHTHSQNIC